MKLPIAKIEDMIEPDHDALSSVYFDKEHGELIASDGFGMVAIPVDSGDDDVSGCIPTEAIKFARKRRIDVTLHDPMRAEIRMDNGYLWQKRHEGYPESARRIISDVLAGEKDCVIISLDAKRLVQLAEALLDEPSNCVVLKIRGEGEPVLIRPYYDSSDSRFGIIMPLADRGEE